MKSALTLVFVLAAVQAELGAQTDGVVVETIADGPRRIRLATGTQVELWSADQTTDGRAKYSIRTSDGRASGVRDVEPMLMLRRASFDPLDASTVRRARTLAATGSIRIVQFETQVLEEYTSALSDLGVELLRILHNQAVIVQVPPVGNIESTLRALEFVRWVGPYPAEYRVDAELLVDLGRAAMKKPSRHVIQVMRRGLLDKRSVARSIRAMGGDVEPLTPSGFLLTASMTSDQMRRVAELDRVFWIEPKKQMVTTTNKVRVDGGANFLEFKTGFTGQGVNGAIIDIGFVKGHPDLASNYPIVHRGGACNGGHGTQVSSILFADGLTIPVARGLLPDGQPILTTARALGDRYTHAFEALFPPYEAVFESNSWGTGVRRTPGYPNAAFELDDIILLYDTVTVQGFGNSGTREALDEAWAKNVVTVGGIRHQDTQTLADDMWAMAGSIGPAEDKRIKPDLCYWFDGIRTMASTFGGTSAATPQVSGYFGLFFQMWHEESFGNVGKKASVFASRPHSATARAALFNSTNAYPFAGKKHDLTRWHQGWGRPSVANLNNIGNGSLVIDEWVALKNLERTSYQVVVAPGQATLRATLVFTDPAGTTSSSLHRINNLDLRLTSPSGVSYWGNQKMLFGNVTPPGGIADRRNTTEQIWLVNPEAGTWLVEVLATEVVQDAHLETPELDADFGLFVGGVEPAVTDLGYGAQPGSFGTPQLELKGALVEGSPWRFDAIPTSPFGLTFVVFGDGQVNLPLWSGGTLVPEPDFVIPTKLGVGTLEGVMPAGVQSGALFYAQAFELDLLWPWNIASSDAIQLRIP